MKSSLLALRTLCSSVHIALASVLLSAAATAHAQATKIFVASFGNDANDGSRGSPKRNFQPAHDAVAADGQIVALDTAGYGALTITKGLTVTVPPGVNGFITISPTNADGISISAPTNATVALRGLIIEGGPNSSRFGIQAITVGTLVLEDCTIRKFSVAIDVFATNAMEISVHNCVARSGSDALRVRSSAGAAVLATVSDCRFEQNQFNGAYASVDGGGSVDMTLANCTIFGNSTGVQTQGAGTVMRVDNCRITGNTTSGAFNNNGQLLSRGNNTFEKNGGVTTFPGTYTAK